MDTITCKEFLEQLQVRVTADEFMRLTQNKLDYIELSQYLVASNYRDIASELKTRF
jgi:hypothetical protein